MNEWKIDFKELLIDIFWWNPKLFKIILSHIEKKNKTFLMFIKWKVKIKQKSIQNVIWKML
jgi:hypothetical protein